MIRKFIKRKKSLLFKNMPKLTVDSKEEEIELSSPISSSIKATIRTYNFPDTIAISISTRGLLSLYEPIEFMEDYEDVSMYEVKGRKFQQFSVYDGHGGRDPKTGIKKGGYEVAQECVACLPVVIKDTLKHLKNNEIEVALAKSFEKADKDYFLKYRDRFPENVGSTAIVILRDIENKTLYVANLGDSRAVICKNGQVEFETVDSDWTNNDELRRIGINKNNQSYVVRTKNGENKKFILHGRFLNGEKWNLATSRSFGDYHFKLDSDYPPVIAKPDIKRVPIDENMKLLLIASDGIWENFKGFTSEFFISKFIQIARKQNPTLANVNICLKETCKEFVKWCMIDLLKLDIKSYGDNISLIAVGLLRGQGDKDKLQWFQSIQQWKFKYDDSPILQGISDTIPEESQDDDDYEDSDDCKIDFTQL